MPLLFHAAKIKNFLIHYSATPYILYYFKENKKMTASAKAAT
jgi:hypothetical protein